MITQTQQTSNPILRRWLAILAALVGLLVAYSVVSAAMITIETNDGLVDPNWAANPYTQLAIDHPRNTAISETVDIKNAWFANDSTFITFRIQTYAGPLASPDKVAVGILDCNLDNDADDSVDRKIVFNPNNDTYVIYRGNGEFLSSIDVTRSERIADSVEFKVMWTNMDPACHTTNPNHTKLAFAIAASGGAVLDQAGFYDWNVPTSVTLKEFSGSSGISSEQAQLMLLGGGLSLFFLVIGGWYIRRAWRA